MADEAVGVISVKLTMEARREPVSLQCEVHGKSNGVYILGNPGTERVCEPCWRACAARVPAFTQLLLGALVRYYPDHSVVPPGWTMLRQHLQADVVHAAETPPQDALEKMLAGRCYCGREIAWVSADGKKGTCGAGHPVVRWDGRGGPA